MTDQLDLGCEFTLVGKLQKDFILPINHQPVHDAPGGNLMYAAVGLNMWEGKAGLVARVSSDYNLEWLQKLADLRFDLSGIIQCGESFDMRYFAAYSDPQTIHLENPLNHFADLRLPLPQALLGYESENGKKCNKNAYGHQSIHISDIPNEYRDVRAAHICPIDYISHKTVPSILRSGLIQTLSMSSASCYMDPLFWNDLPILISDLTIFMTEEKDIRSLFQGRSVDLWEMADELTSYGPEYIIIHLKDGGHLLLDRISQKRWKIPAYPITVVDPTGVNDAFAGAFLVVYQKTYEPLEGALAGAIAASFVVGGSGPFYALDAMPGLKEARLGSLKEKVIEK